MFGYLQYITVLYPRQVLARVVAELTDSNLHALVLPHLLPQGGCCRFPTTPDPSLVRSRQSNPDARSSFARLFQ